MVWPSTQSPLGIETTRTLDRTILGRHYSNSRKPVSGLWSRTSSERESYLSQLDLWRDLPKDVLNKYSRAEFKDVKRIIHLWRAIEVCIITSNLDLLGKPVSSLHRRLWRWFITTAIHSYDDACQKWKKVCLHVRDFTQTLDYHTENKFPQGVPGGRNGHLGPLWFGMLPWLNDFSLAKVLKDKTIITASLLEKVTHFIQTRVEPPPPLTEKRFDMEVKELRRQFSKKPSLTTQQRADVIQATRRLINYIGNGEIKTRPHLSLSATGKFESTRAEGGGAIYACRKYLERFVWRIPDKDYVGTSWWGAPINELRGIKPYKTVARYSRLQDGILFLTNSFRDEMAPDELMMTIFAEVNEHRTVEDPLFGLDEAFPHQLLQLAVEQNVSMGYVPGPPCEWEDPQIEKRFIRTPIRTKLIAQPESGNKVRFLSEPPTFVTLMLQPFGHWLSDVVGGHPALRSAFNRSMKGWDFAVDLSRSNRGYSPGEGLSVYDLSGASNMLNNELLYEVLSRLINAFAKNRYEAFFFHQCLGLLLAPRYMYVKRDLRDDKHRVILTEDGIHMSDPGCKPALCLASVVVELIVFKDVPRPPPFAIAGDDVANLVTREKHLQLVETHNSFGHEVKLAKTQWSTIWVNYCEECVRLIETTIGCGKAPWQLDYETEDLHIDNFKLRLLMPFSAVDNSIDRQRNPAVGKGDALWSQIKNHKRPEVVTYVKNVFRIFMADYIGRDPVVFLPRIVGGQNVPFCGEPEELYRKILDRTGTKVVAIYNQLRFGEEPFPLFGSLTRKMSTGGSSRGLIDPSSQYMIIQYGEILFKQWRDRAKSLATLKEELQEKKTFPVSFGDAKRYARKSGYISYADIADTLDRISAIRISMACAAGAIPVDEITTTKEGRLPSPSEVLDDFVSFEVERQDRKYRIHQDLFSTTPEDCEAFKKWIFEGNPNFSVRAQGLYVPKCALVDSLNGMTVTMPYKPSRTIPGSEEDPYVGSEFQTEAAFVISRKRF